MEKNIQKTNQSHNEIKLHNKGSKVIDYLKKNHSIISFIVLAFAGIIVYSNTFNCSFHFDDKQITDDYQLLRNFSNFTDINFWNHPGRQVAFLSFALNYHFNKFDVFGYHLINIVIHIVTGFFVFLLIKLILHLISI
jgi:protein O-mannosyl-transferase